MCISVASLRHSPWNQSLIIQRFDLREVESKIQFSADNILMLIIIKFPFIIIIIISE